MGDAPCCTRYSTNLMRNPLPLNMIGSSTRLADKLPKVADHLDDARADLLAFTAFPKQIWRQIWSNNPLSVNRPSQDTSRAAA